MKAIGVFPADRQVRLIDHPDPPPVSPTQVKMRMLEVGVCGTDREIVSFQYGTPPAGSAYLVLGHESLGQVEAVGSEVRDLKPGDLAVLMVRRPCPHADCVACRAGRQDFCYTGDFTERGIRQAHGFMTQWVVDEARYVVKVPAALRPVAVLTEPLTIAQKALEQILSIQERLPWGCPVEPAGPRQANEYCHRALVIGAGPVGLLGAMTLCDAGFQTYVYSREPADGDKAQMVAAIGARYLSSTALTPEHLPDEIGNIDVVYEAAGASRIAFEVIKVLGTNGVFCFTGVPGRKGEMPVDTDLIMRDLVLENQVVFGTVNAGHQAFEDAVRSLERFTKRWPKTLAGLITGRFSLEQAPDVLTGPATGIKNVIEVAENL